MENKLNIVLNMVAEGYTLAGMTAEEMADAFTLEELTRFYNAYMRFKERKAQGL